MNGDYLDDLYGDLGDWDDLQSIWDEYDRQKKQGEQDYYDWKWRNQPSVPDHMLDQIVDEFDEDFSWDEIEQVFKQRLGDEFNRRDKLDLMEKLDKDLPIHGEDKKKPKI